MESLRRVNGSDKKTLKTTGKDEKRKAGTYVRSFIEQFVVDLRVVDRRFI